MKYVEGDTLDVIIRKLRDGDPATRAKYDHVARAHVFLSLLQALRYAHEKGVIHRDLKPSNVMVGPYGEVMLMDWGIAKKIERGVADGPESGLADTVDPKLGPQRLVQTAVGSLLGTPLYMSPEQAAGKVNELDERSDVYSAALVLLELLSLHHPYEDRKTVPELLIAQSRDELGGTELGMLLAADEAPQQFIWFLHKALHKDRAQRYATVAEMERELRRVLDGRVAVQCGVTFGKRMGEEYLHWIDRNPRGFLLALKLVGLLVIGLLVLCGVQLVRAF
jgi:eukaryotic-like serine/threonine-protein kinase